MENCKLDIFILTKKDILYILAELDFLPDFADFDGIKI